MGATGIAQVIELFEQLRGESGERQVEGAGLLRVGEGDRRERPVGQVLLELVDIPEDLQRDDSFPPVLGHLVGTLAKDRVPVIDGLSVDLSEDQLKALCAGAASAGSVNLFHIIGQTPEAGTREEAFAGHEPAESHRATLEDLAQVRSLPQGLRMARLRRE